MVPHDHCHLRNPRSARRGERSHVKATATNQNGDVVAAASDSLHHFDTNENTDA